MTLTWQCNENKDISLHPRMIVDISINYSRHCWCHFGVVPFTLYSCCRVCCALSPKLALHKCRSVIVHSGLVGFIKTCFYIAVSPFTMSHSTRLQSKHCFSAATECQFHWDHNMYMTLFVPPPSTSTNGGMDPAGELCWKSSFQLLSPLHIPPLVPSFHSFFLPFFLLFNRCLFSVRVLRSVAEVICFARARSRFV